MRVNREGKEVVLRAALTNEDRQRISTVIHYRVLDHGHTLVEDEWILAPGSSEHNLWVSTRMATQSRGRKKP